MYTPCISKLTDCNHLAGIGPSNFPKLERYKKKKEKSISASDTIYKQKVVLLIRAYLFEFLTSYVDVRKRTIGASV